MEQVPAEGVASPHTAHTHAYIQEMRKKHGLDYDTHASYRFVETKKPRRAEKASGKSRKK
jgi:hypothetical protein